VFVGRSEQSSQLKAVLQLTGHLPLAVEMEGAAVAQVYFDYGVEFAIKIIYLFHVIRRLQAIFASNRSPSKFRDLNRSLCPAGRVASNIARWGGPVT